MHRMQIYTTSMQESGFHGGRGFNKPIFHTYTSDFMIHEVPYYWNTNDECRSTKGTRIWLPKLYKMYREKLKNYRYFYPYQLAVQIAGLDMCGVDVAHLMEQYLEYAVLCSAEKSWLNTDPRSSLGSV